MEDRPLLLLADGEAARPEELPDVLHRHLEREGLPSPWPSWSGWIARPLLLREQRRRYEMLGGGSGQADALIRLAGGLAARLSDQGLDRLVMPAFLDREPSFEQRIKRLHAQGASEIDLISLDPFNRRARTEHAIEALYRKQPSLGLRLRRMGTRWGERVDLLRLLVRQLRSALEGAGPDSRLLFLACREQEHHADQEGSAAEAARVLTRLLPDGTVALFARLDRQGGFARPGRSVRAALRQLAAESHAPLLLVPLDAPLPGLETHYVIDVLVRRMAEQLGIDLCLLHPPLASLPGFVEFLADLVLERGR